MAVTLEQGVSWTITAKDITQAAIDSAAAGLKKLESAHKTLQEKMASQFKSIQDNWLKMTAGIASMYGAFRLIEEAAKFEEQKAQLQGLAAQWNTTADAIIAKCKEASDGELSMTQSAQLAAKALLYLTPDQLGPFIEAAERLGKITGKDIPEGFAAFEKAVVTGKSRGLYEALGITVDLDSAMKQYAASLGVNVESLDQQTKMQVRANAIMYEAQRQIEMLGPAIETNADRIDKLKATIADLRLEMGTYLMRAALAAYGGLQWLASGVLNLYSYIKKYTGLYYEARSAASQDAQVSAAYSAMAKESRADADAASQASAAAMGKAVKYINSAIAPTKNLALAMGDVKRAAAEPFGGKNSDEAKRKAIELEKLMQEIRNRQELSNLSHDERELAAMDQKHEQQIQKLAELQATQAQFDEATTLMVQERLNLEYNQHVRHLNARLMESMKAGEEELKLQQKNAEDYLKIQEDKYKRETEMIDYTAAYHEQKIRSALSAAQSDINALISGAGGYNTGVGMMATGMEGITQVTAGQDKWSQEADRAYEHYMTLNEQHLDYTAHKQEIDDAYLEWRNAEEDAAMQKKLATTQNVFNMMAGAAFSYYELTGKKSKAAFNVYKALAIAQTVISTYSAAQMAYESGVKAGKNASNPEMGQLLGVAYAAIAIAAGAARVASIASQSPESGGGGVSSGGGSGSASVSTGTGATSETATTEKVKTSAIAINIYGNIVDQDSFARTLVPYLTKAESDNVH